MTKKILLKIAGMHCPSCEIITKEELSELAGVSDIKVDFKTGTAELLLDEDKNNMADVLAAVKTAGYSAEIESENKVVEEQLEATEIKSCLLYTSDAADDLLCVDL